MLSRNYTRDSEVSTEPEKELDIEAAGKIPAKSITLSGPELITLNENQWSQLCEYDEIVFARTTPEQKLRIVKGMFWE